MSRTLSIYIDSPPLYLCPCAATRRRRLPSLSRVACLAVAAGCAAIALAAAALYSYEWSAHADAAAQAARLSTTLAHVRQLAQAQRQDAAANAADARRQLADAARRLAALQAAIVAAPSADPVALQTALDSANRDLAAAAAANTQLSAQLAQLRQSAVAPALTATPAFAALPAALDRQHDLETANADLHAQVDTLKSQLLQLAAQTSDETPSDPPLAPAPQPLVETRWALGITYDTAAGFANLCFDHNSLRETPADPYRKSAATRADGASTFRFTHDAAHDRVFSATLTLSLSPDAPRDRLTENAKLAALFLHTFAPACKNPDEWLAAATRHLAGKGSSDRLSLLDTTYKITAFNDAHNTFTFKIESPRADLED